MKRKHGIQFMPGVTTVFRFMFADEIVLMSDTVFGPQNQLDSLKEAASKVRLNVNHDKVLSCFPSGRSPGST